MDTYTDVSREINRLITKRYSTSFGLSSTLFDTFTRPHIYAIYGLVRIADEIVDTYRGADAEALLDELERDTLRCMQNGYSPNPVVHAFGQTAREFMIANETVTAFFASMRMDLEPYQNTDERYRTYIYGSAEAVGLMCLSVFVRGDHAEYERLTPGAQALGAAYQKINFLRDLAADNDTLGRWYFPDSSYESFTADDKTIITQDIRADIAVARAALHDLPKGCRRAIALSLAYYERLLSALERTDVATLKHQRLRVSDSTKLRLYFKAKAGLL